MANSSEEAPTWQDLLDSLTSEASRNGLLSKILQLKKKSEFDIAKACFSNEEVRCQLMKWMRSCLDSEDVKKSSQKSTVCRLKGNDKFKLGHDEASLSLYTDCIRFAPHASQELALGFANRSAVLFRMHQFEDCAKDVERALAHPYPENLHLKILLRLARCYLQLQEWDLCRTTLDLAAENLEKNSSHLSEVKLNDFKQELQSLKQEFITKSNIHPCVPLRNQLNVESPPLFCGLNGKFPYASGALEMRHSPEKGRFVVTNQDVKQGDVLFVEKPYAFVVLPEQFKVHCHHCTRVMVAPFPCKKCTSVLFCSESCEENSIASYHHWECQGIALMSAVGIAHLGLRILTVTGTPSKFFDKDLSSSNDQTSINDPYSSVYSLLPHITSMEANDIFQYSATALLLTMYLYHRTDFFVECAGHENRGHDMLIRVCSVLLRHISQLVCNAHAITKLDSPPGSASKNKVVLETQQRIATAIYPSASMMNHSCDPNISNSFLNDTLIVKASRSIPKGGEVLNCYGPHHQRMGTAERQAALLAQYFFFCKCTACDASPGDSFDPVQERLFALKCASCGGPLVGVAGREPAGSKRAQQDAANSHLMLCDCCGAAQPISSLVQDVFKAHTIFRQGCEDLESGQVQEALVKLKHCQELQERCLYRSHKELTATYDTLGKCYAMLGLYDKSIECLKQMLPAIEEQYGENSIEVAHELQKLSDVMMCHLLSLSETPSKMALLDTNNVIKRAQNILTIQYGEWYQGWQDLHTKADQLNVLCKLAAGENDVNVQIDFEGKLKLES